jgi:ketosteroid isomerase-like protein
VGDRLARVDAGPTWCHNGGVTETNVERARRGYEAALRGDFDVISAFLAPDVKWHGGDPSAPGACRSREQALEFMRQAAGRRGVGELIEIVDAGDKVVVIMRPPSKQGQHAALSANLATFRDGKVIEWCTMRTPRTHSPLRVSDRRPAAVRRIESVCGTWAGIEFATRRQAALRRGSTLSPSAPISSA